VDDAQKINNSKSGAIHMGIGQVFRGHANAFLERAKTRAILADALCNDIPKVNSLMCAYDLGIISTIEANYPIQPVLRTTFINSIVNQYSMNNAAAQWAIDTWIQIMTPATIRDMNTARKLQEAEKSKMGKMPEQSTKEEENDIPELSGQDELIVRTDILERFVNVKLDKKPGKILIPCGVGTTDNGFYICGIKELKEGMSLPSFALVYNFLIRNSTIQQEDYPHYLSGIRTTFAINYQRIYRLMIIILQLIKNGANPSKLDVSYDGNKEEILLAVDILNHYHDLFCRLIGIKPKKIIWEKNKPNQPVISLDKKRKGIWVENVQRPTNARELWYATKINYNLSERNQEDLEYLLGEISPYDSFKEGQFAALTSMLNAGGHAMCIMPTGSGKSLIFYFAALLQPSPVMVIAPTDILIDDQIRNLGKYHHFDNVSHLRLTATNDFRDFHPCNSIMYITPMTFQSRHLLVKCRHLNDEYETLSYVVLDEIHCLSNWGHDFRPEYLMLSKFLNKYLSRISFLGFTATANYTVVEDIQTQLSIPQENIFSPIRFEKYNISYNFKSVETEQEMLDETCKIVAKQIARGERTLIFTKSEEISCKLAEAIGYEADVFQKGNPTAYHLFADGQCNVLVANDDLGIGVNLPDVKNVIHFGLPVSKNEFVQEIGRAGRADEAVSSYVIYLQPTPENVPAVLLSRETSSDDLEADLRGCTSDYADCFLKLNNGVLSKKQLEQAVMKLYDEFASSGRGLLVKKYNSNQLDSIKRQIYMLYLTGFVNDWYAYSGDDTKGSVEIMIDISSTNHYEYADPSVMLNRMKQRMVAYYSSMSNNRKQIVLTQRATENKEIIGIYIDWYYSRFLYHHKEQFLDLFDFIESNAEGDNERITADIQNYFSLPFAEIKSDENYYRKMSFKDIGNKVAQGIGWNTVVNAEHINSNQYAVNLDFLIFLGTLKLRNKFDGNRFDRIIKKTNDLEKDDIRLAFKKVFEYASPASRLSLIYPILSYPMFFGNTPEQVCDRLYSGVEKDVVYYGIASMRMNRLFTKGENNDTFD